MVILKNATGENKCKKQLEVSLKPSSTTSFFLEILLYLVKVLGLQRELFHKAKKKLPFGGILAVF